MGVRRRADLPLRFPFAGPKQNVAFARTAFPDDAAIAARASLLGTVEGATVPGSMAEERATNPFLRARTVEEFTDLRRRRDAF